MGLDYKSKRVPMLERKPTKGTVLILLLQIVSFEKEAYDHEEGADFCWRLNQ